ncbi:hypothetical protein [Streptomyces sp. AN091965]|uniref:hypothetical protein n=1 Tax=Streptomyces sp. AN091965 TaxID=2927803 RepID=UPI001F61676C|nr:hypothetical protein [Streptomyces sp. AN091965]MCI3930190.1 hypothetical protein [Streptomyces sp. AN091965]
MTPEQIFNKSGADLSAEAQRALDGTRQQGAANAESARAVIDRVMDRKGLTDQARQAAASRTFRQAQARAEQLVSEHIAGVERFKQSRLDRAFGARGGDAQSLMARRQAQQMVTSADEDWKAMDLLKTAQQDGDTQLAQVVAGHAYSMGWTDVVDQWNHDGAHNTAIAGLLEAQQLPDTNDIGWRMGVAAEYYVDKPAVLDGLRDHEIDRLARDDLGGEAA